MKIAKGSDQANEIEQDALLSDDLRNIPYQFSRDHGVLLRGGDGDRFVVAFREGSDPVALLEVRRYLSMPFDVDLVAPEAFEQLLGEHYAMDGSAAAMASDFDTEGLDDLAGDIPSAEDLLDSADDAPTIRLINGIIAEAARAGASDIHVEPYETGLVVRMRIQPASTTRSGSNPATTSARRAS